MVTGKMVVGVDRSRWAWTSVVGALVIVLAVVGAAAKKAPPAVAQTATPPTPKEESVIEEVSAKQLERVLNEKDYVAVFWYTRSCHTCDKVLLELEKIDDDTDNFGVDFVKINDKRLAKHYGIKTFPALTYFREKEPIIYEGDLMDEENVLDFLTSLEAMDLPDRIEEVNGRILGKIVEDSPYVAVLFCPSAETCPSSGTGPIKPACKKCSKALQELENIDDEADQLGIGFVKIQDEELAEEYNLGELPRLVYYRHQIPIIYENELTREEDVLEWLVQNKSTGDEEDVIEDVTAKSLNTLIGNIDNLVVLFYDNDDEDSMQVLAELEKIDDDCDKQGIQFVKIDDAAAAKEFGIDNVPALVYFEKEIPNVYDGDLENEDEILEWLISQLESDEIEDVTDEMLDKMIKEGKTLAVLFYDNNDRKSQRVLNELENIDDECDKHGIIFVKIDNAEEAAEYGIDKLPVLIYFENGIPLVYEGSLEEEEKVLEWLEHQQKSDEIEDVTDEMLDMLIDKLPNVAVLFYDKDQKTSQKVLLELENIDDDCDKNNIAFVKIDNDAEAREYGIDELPTLVYFEHKIPHVYDGDLNKEEELLKWLIRQKKHSEIPEITNEMMDKILEKTEYLAVLFYNKEDKQDMRVLNELENIDDDLEKENIVIVRMDDEDTYKQFGIDELPTLVYFESKLPAIYEGDLLNENEVLEWLIEQKNSATIEEVTDEILEDLIAEHEYVVVYFSGPCEEEEEDQECENILEELENIDDELDEAGIIFVTTEDTSLAKKHGVKTYPALVFFRNKMPLVFKGDIEDEDEVLAWITDEETLEIPGKIEEVNSKMLDKIIAERSFVVVFFYAEGDKKSQKIIQELEEIDDECEEKDITFVKTSDENIQKEYDLPSLPSLVFYRNKFRTIYQGDLMQEEAILEWVLKRYEKAPDVIESVDRKTLQVLINDVEHLAVFFYDDSDKCAEVLEELETIDDDTDKHGIQFVKSKDSKLASEIGIFSFPALVYYETGVPIMYDGNLKYEEKVLEWLIEQKSKDEGGSEKEEGVQDNQESEDEIINSSEGFFSQWKRKLASKVWSSESKDGEDDNRNGKESDEDGYNGMEVSKSTLKAPSKTAEAKLVVPEKPKTRILSASLKKLSKNEIDANIKLHVDGSIKQPNIDYDDNKDDDDVSKLPKLGQFHLQKTKKGREGKALSYVIHPKTDKKISLSRVNHQKDDDEDDDVIDNDDDIYNDRRDAYYNFYSGLNVFNLFDPEEGTEEEVALSANEETCKGDCQGDGCFIIGLGGKTVIPKVSYEPFQCCPTQLKKNTKIPRVEKEPAGNKKNNKQKNKDSEEKLNPKLYSKTPKKPDSAALLPIKTDKSSKSDKKKNIGNGVLRAPIKGDLLDESHVLDWMVAQKMDESIPDIDRETLFDYIDTKEFLAVVWYNEEDPEAPRILRHIELIDDEASEYGIKICKCSDRLMAKKYGYRKPPGITYFRKGKYINYDGDIDDDEEILDWLTHPENMELTDHIERVNRRMFQKIRQTSDYTAVFFYSGDCKQCDRVLAEIEHIDDEADGAGIKFVKINDRAMAKEIGVFALPAVAFFKLGSKEPVIYAGDLYDEEQILSWLMTQKDPSGDAIEALEGDDLRTIIEESDSLAIYFWNQTLCELCSNKHYRKMMARKSHAEAGAAEQEPHREDDADDTGPDDCEQCQTVMEELENIDDDCDRHGIAFVKTQDYEVAKDYGVSEFPSLVYFEKGIPNVFEGDLMEEEEVLQWLITQRTEDRIELVTRIMLESMVEETQYLAVYFYKQNCHICDELLEGLEHIDDECDVFGIHMVKIQDPPLAKRYGIKTFPALVYFRNGNPLLYEGDLQNEEAVLEWLVDDDNRELADEIEQVNSRMLERLLDESNFLAVFFYDEEDCSECLEILEELEKIDGEADLFGIDMVKISDQEVSAKYGISNTPALVYFRKRVPLVYDGDLSDADKVLTWLTSLENFDNKNEIEEVNRKMLDKLLEENEFLSVFFYELDHPESERVLERLENIDDEIENIDITFVKMADPRYARKWGVTKLPAIVFFRKRFPSIYRGELHVEDEVLEWLRKNSGPEGMRLVANNTDSVEVVEAACLQRWGSTLPRRSTDYSAIGEPPRHKVSPFPYDPKLNSRICLWEGDVSCLSVDGIVHSTNEAMSDRNPISDRIHWRAGPGLKQQIRHEIKECRTGEVRVTHGHGLPARFIIHTVGPRYNIRYQTAAENTLHTCYRTVLQKARELCLATLGLAVINSVRRNYPPDAGAHVALRTVRRFLEAYPDAFDVLVFVVESADIGIYEVLLPLYFPRSQGEEEAARWQLPVAVGGPRGEPLLPDRQIRIIDNPHHRFRDKNLEIQASEDLCLHVGEHEFSQMQGDLDQQRLLGERPPSDPVADILIKELQQKERYERLLRRAKTEDLSEVSGIGCLYQCGVDRFGRPVVIFVGKWFKFKEIDLDKALLYLIYLLDPLVKNDYIIIYFHTMTTAANHPSFTWLREVYNILPYKYKKNLKAFYIVHPTIWTKMVSWWFTTFMAPAIKEKVHNLDGVEYLYSAMAPNQLEIPAYITEYDMTINGLRYFQPEAPT